MQPLADKLALVTGASRGIGKAIALQLAREGAEVIVHFADRSEAAEAVAQTIRSEGGQAETVQADLSRLSEIEKLFDDLDRRLAGRKLDILVHNAGIIERAGLEQITEEQYDAQFNINVKAPFFITRLALPRFNDGGRIITVSSNLSLRPRHEVGAYAMTKAAINNLTVSLAGALGPRQITVNAVAPGVTDTDMNAQQLENEALKALLTGQTALGRIGKAEDTALVVAFLVSPAAGWVTGQYIEVSGGFGLKQ